MTTDWSQNDKQQYVYLWLMVATEQENIFAGVFGKRWTAGPDRHTF